MIQCLHLLSSVILWMFELIFCASKFASTLLDSDMTKIFTGEPTEPRKITAVKPQTFETTKVQTQVCIYNSKVNMTLKKNIRHQKRIRF